MSATLVQVDFQGSPYVGVFLAASDKLLLAPPTAPVELVRTVEQALGTPALVMGLGGANVTGTVVAMNARGAVVADLATDDQVSELEKRGLRVGVLEGKLNAAGNNVLCNDRGALIHPDFSVRQLDAVRDALRVEVAERGTIAGISTVGSVAVATNKGCLTHPRITPAEKQRLERVLGVTSNLGTANHGTPYLGACIVANGHGAAIGRLTTGPEMNRLEDTLGYL